MLQLRDVHTFYGASHVLHGVSLDVAPGSIAGVVGRNGMGKTTVIRSITALTPPRMGSIRFNGRELRGLPPHVIARQGIALVPQGRRVFPSLTVEENLLAVARGPGRWTLDAVYGLFGRLRERRAHRGNQLSGGEQQMLAIGRALMTNPRLLLMDEPSEGLAPRLVEQVGEVLLTLRALGQSILLVEQNLGLVLQTVDRVYVLSKGQVAWRGSPQELERAEEILAEHLGVGGAAR
jgi:branched-chain amino acid transport system ATP-binding protein